MILFVKEHCAFSKRTLKAVEGLKAPVSIKWKHEDGVIDEIIQKGGKQQFPFLWDEENNTGMYESTEIIQMLCQKFGNGEFPPDDDSDESHFCSVE